MYTTFTSPLRSYPDILVHRALAASIGSATNPTLSHQRLEPIIDRCNEKRSNANRASRCSLEMCFLKYLKSVKILRLQAAIVEVFCDHFTIILMHGVDKVLKIYADVSYKQFSKLLKQIYLLLYSFQKHKPKLQLEIVQTVPRYAQVTYPDGSIICIKPFVELSVNVYVGENDMLVANIIPHSLL